MIFWVAAGLAAVLVLARVVVLVLDDVAENHDGAGAIPYGSPTGWWPDADEPVDLQLTGLGEAAADHPSEFVLDEHSDPWRPA